MSAKWSFFAWEVGETLDGKPLKSGEKLALLCLANNADDSGESWYSVEAMAKKSSMSVRTFQESIKKLEKGGLIEVIRRSNKTSIYKFNEENFVRFTSDAVRQAVERSTARGAKSAPQENSDNKKSKKNPTLGGAKTAPQNGEGCENCTSRGAKSADDPNNDPNNSILNTTSDFSDEVKKCVDYIFEKFEPNMLIKRKPSKSWFDAIEKLNRLDNVDFRTICEVGAWAANDSFWQSNILSAPTLRKQFNKLYGKMKNETNIANSSVAPSGDKRPRNRAERNASLEQRLVKQYGSNGNSGATGGVTINGVAEYVTRSSV
ncbi:TPA: helix-turn-helix domain-containing protein [Vibrio harveyi]|nr:helix-turn-helix domain-containing protein [Vibrio harveyi]